MSGMESAEEKVARFFGNTKPLSDGELASALRKLAFEGIAVPKHLMRHAYTGEIGSTRYYGRTLEAVPPALDRLGEDREPVVVGLIRRLEQAVRDHHDHVKSHSGDAALGKKAAQRYFDVAFLVTAAKPKTIASVTQVADFLRSEKDEVREKASEMLEATPYCPVVIDRLFENVATHGIRQWPNRQSRALASFTYVAEVRERVLKAFKSQEENLRSLAVMTFSYLGEKAGADAEAELFAIAENDGDGLQPVALSALHEVTPRSERLRKLALRLIHSDKFWVRGHAIACLEPFYDGEVREALLLALVDEGGHDFDNAGTAAKLLGRRPLDASNVLAPLMSTLRTLLEREDKLYEGQANLSGNVQLPDDWSKASTGEKEELRARFNERSYPDAETLLTVARLLGRLGPAAVTAIPLIEECAKRPYASGGSEEDEWAEIVKAIQEG